MSSGIIEYDWTKPEPQILVDMIQADNTAVVISEDMLIFGIPETITPNAERSHNTKVLISATPAAPFYGSQNHYYHRVDINDFIFSGITNTLFYLVEHGTKETLAEELSERLGVYLTADKLDIEIPEEPTDNVVVRISDTSLCYFGEFTIRYEWYIPDLAVVIKKTDFEGFYF